MPQAPNLLYRRLRNISLLPVLNSGRGDRPNTCKTRWWTKRQERGSQEEEDKIGFLDENTRAIFGRSYAAEPDILVEQLRKDEAIAEADTLLLTISNQLGVAYNADVMEAILTTVAPALGWR